MEENVKGPSCHYYSNGPFCGIEFIHEFIINTGIHVHDLCYYEYEIYDR